MVNWGDKSHCLRCRRALTVENTVRCDDGLAWASLMLGLGGFLLFGLSSLVGLIMGLLALRRIRRQPATYGGRGYALAGVAASCLSLIFLTALGVYLAQRTEILRQAQSELKIIAARPLSSSRK